MSTGTQIVDSALNHIGVQSEVQEASAAVKAECFRHLQSVIAMMEKQRIIMRETDSAGDVQRIAIPADITGEVNEPLPARDWLELFLGIDFASKARIPVTPLMLAQRGKAYNRLAQMYRCPPVVEADQSSLLHRGQGYEQYERSSRYTSQYFPAPEYTDDCEPNVEAEAVGVIVNPVGVDPA